MSSNLTRLSALEDLAPSTAFSRLTQVSSMLIMDLALELKMSQKSTL